MQSTKLRIKRFVARLIRWAMVESTGSDEDPYPHQQVTYLGTGGESQVWFPYGFHALAPAGTLALMFAMSGDSDSRTHMPGSPRERTKVKEGEVVMYHPKTGAKVHFKDDGTIEIVAAEGSPVKIETTGDIECDSTTLRQTGALNVVGGLTLGGAINHNGSQAGFFGETPITKPAVSGGDSGVGALETVCNALHELGLIDDASYPR